MAEAGIDKAIIFPMPMSNLDWRMANQYVLGISQAYQNKLIPFVLMNPNFEYLQRLLDKSARGVKQHDFGQGIHLNDLERFEKIYLFMQEKGIPLIWHSGIPVVDRVKRVKEYAPELNIILAHCGAEFMQKNNYQAEFNNVKD